MPSIFDPNTNTWSTGKTPAPPVMPKLPTVPDVQAGLPNNLDTITNRVNQLNIAGQAAANQARIPGSVGLEAQSSALIANQLAGRVPPDVIRMLQQSAAERGVGQGISGSPNENAAYLRALGLTSLDLQKTGQENLTAALSRNPAARTFNPQEYMTTPAQAAQLNNQAAEINLRGILGQAGLTTDQWKAILEAQTRLEAAKISPTPWWATNNQPLTPSNIPAGATWLSPWSYSVPAGPGIGGG